MNGPGVGFKPRVLSFGPLVLWIKHEVEVASSVLWVLFSSVLLLPLPGPRWAKARRVARGAKKTQNLHFELNKNSRTPSLA